MIAPESGVKTSENGVTASECGMAASESGMTASECGMAASESGVMESESGVMVSESETIASADGKTASEITVFAINPGSTSTKIALVRDGQALFSANVSHDADALAAFEDISSQLPYRRDTIIEQLEAENIDLAGVDAFVGRGGGLLAVEGGTYVVDEVLLRDATIGANGVVHPAQLGSQLAHEFAALYGKPVFVVNPPDTDELQDVARLTGIKGVHRNVHLHALNQKETALRHAESIGRRYEECSFVVAHIGGGTSIAAHRKGRMVDGNDIVGGEGPMAPTRCGAVPVSELLKYSQGKDLKELKALCTSSGGFVSLLGTADAVEVVERARKGDRFAQLAWDTMIYQIVKEIGAMAAVLHGQVDGVLLGGGLVNNQSLVESIRLACEWIAPVTAYPGEFEMEAMAAGAVRVLTGAEEAKTYTGIPCWNKADFE